MCTSVIVYASVNFTEEMMVMKSPLLFLSTRISLHSFYIKVCSDKKFVGFDSGRGRQTPGHGISAAIDFSYCTLAQATADRPIFGYSDRGCCGVGTGRPTKPCPSGGSHSSKGTSYRHHISTVQDTTWSYSTGVFVRTC